MNPKTAGLLVGIGLGTVLAGTAWALAYYAARPVAVRRLGKYVADAIRGSAAGPLLQAAQAPGWNDAIGAAVTRWADENLP